MTQLVRFDWAIKYLLRNKANFDILEGFLSELLNIDLYIENILESESNKQETDDKFNRVDLLVKTVEGHHIIIELQCSSQWDYLSRILYGTSKVVCEQLKEGDPYRNVRKVISVSIVFFDLGAGKDYLYKGRTNFVGMHFRDSLSLNEHERLLYQVNHHTQAETPQEIFPEYYIIKLNTFRDRVKSKIDEWIYFLKRGEIKPDFSAKGIQSAVKKLNVLELSPQARKAYEQHQESLHDDASLNAMFEVVREEAETKGLVKGRAEGLEEGRHLERESIAKKMKANGLSLKNISVCLNMTINEVQTLLQDAKEPEPI